MAREVEILEIPIFEENGDQMWVASTAQQSIRSVTPPSRGKLKEWWDDILHYYDDYHCYAFFLALPTDDEAVRYLHEFGEELELITGKNCLLILLTQSTVGSPELDKRLTNYMDQQKLSSDLVKNMNEAGKNAGLWKNWKLYMHQHWKFTLLREQIRREHRDRATKDFIARGYSLMIGKFFRIKTTQFPCVIIFNDIHSSEHTLIKLKGETAEQISERLRGVFFAIDIAITEKQDVLKAVKSYLRRESISQTGKAVIQRIRKIADTTYQTAIYALIDATTKPT